MSQFPQYALYGEDEGDRFEEFFHCETIAVRSRRYDWEISPHVHLGLSQMLYVTRGTVDARLGQEWHHLTGPVILSVPQGLVHGFRFSPEVVGFIITASRDFLDSLGRQDVLRVRMREATYHIPSAGRARSLLQIGRSLLEAEKDRFNADTHRLHRSLAEAWLRLAIQPSLEKPDGRGNIAHRFQTLIDTNYREHKPLAFYAEQLNCTVRTLSRHCFEAFGMSPLQLINRHLYFEARRLLRFTAARANEVSAELGFEDATYFSRFYRRMCGHSPSKEMADAGRR